MREGLGQVAGLLEDHVLVKQHLAFLVILGRPGLIILQVKASVRQVGQGGAGRARTGVSVPSYVCSTCAAWSYCPRRWCASAKPIQLLRWLAFSSSILRLVSCAGERARVGAGATSRGIPRAAHQESGKLPHLDLEE